MEITQSSSGRKTRGAFFVARQPQKTVDGRPWGILDRNLVGQNMTQWRPNEAKAPTQEETCMRILPELSDAMKIAAQGIYKVLPVSCEILSDICTPIEALKKLKKVSAHCYMLESVVEREKWGRYTFLGYDPTMEITQDRRRFQCHRQLLSFYRG